jgi:DNA mismatch endonuclease (patch repair protein)
MVDKLTPQQRSKVMSAIRGKGTKIELRLAKALWTEGLRYRKNDKSVFGTPDLVFKGKKVAIFVDSEFWHGKDWINQKNRIKTNSEFWINKIEANIRRDILVNITLQEKGWTVIRFWGKEIEKELDYCVQQVKEALYLPSFSIAAEPDMGYKKSLPK